MPNLGEHYDDAGGQYLPEGDHLVTVKSARFFTYHSGNEGVEFVLADKRGREIKVAFSRLGTALWMIASFAKACGLTREQCNAFDTDNLGAYQRYLVGRAVNVTVVKGAVNPSTGKQYSEVDKDHRAWWPADIEREAEPATAKAPMPSAVNPATAANSTAPSTAAGETSDDCPF